MAQHLCRIRAMRPATVTRRSALAELRQAARALNAARRRSSSPFAMSCALTALARACRGLHDEVNAEGYLDEALRWARAAGSIDLVVDLLCELCEMVWPLKCTLSKILLKLAARICRTRFH